MGDMLYNQSRTNQYGAPLKIIATIFLTKLICIVTLDVPDQWSATELQS